MASRRPFSILNSQFSIPDDLRRNIIELRGRAGEDWLARIPALLDACAARWSLTLDAPYPDVSYNYVMRVVRADGSPAVLKLAFPGEEAQREADALRAFGGRGAVTLFDYDADRCALLIERAEPGELLARERDDERAMAIAAGVMRALHRGAPERAEFPTVATWRSDLERAPDALAVFDELIASSTRNVLLHGDFHPFNILDAGDRWLAIDPKGIIGEPECEIAPLVLNLYADPHRRIGQLCDEAELNRARAYRWTYVRTVLAVLWAEQDHGTAPGEWMECAAELRGRLYDDELRIEN